MKKNLPATKQNMVLGIESHFRLCLENAYDVLDEFTEEELKKIAPRAAVLHVSERVNSMVQQKIKEED